MNGQTIIKVFRNLKKQPKKYSLGFRRLVSLPKEVRCKINLACVLKGEHNDNSMKLFLDEMTNQEYINWMKMM